MNLIKDVSTSSSLKSVEVMYSMMHLFVTLMETSTIASINPPFIAFGQRRACLEPCRPSKRSWGQPNRKRNQTGPDAEIYSLMAETDSVPTKNCNRSRMESSGWILLTLLDEDSSPEELIFFFSTDLIDNNDGFMTTKQENSNKQIARYGYVIRI